MPGESSICARSSRLHWVEAGFQYDHRPHHPDVLAESRTPASGVRPWLDSIFPIAARMAQSSPGQRLADCLVEVEVVGGHVGFGVGGGEGGVGLSAEHSDGGGAEQHGKEQERDAADGGSGASRHMWSGRSSGRGSGASAGEWHTA